MCLEMCLFSVNPVQLWIKYNSQYLLFVPCVRVLPCRALKFRISIYLQKINEADEVKH